MSPLIRGFGTFNILFLFHHPPLTFLPPPRKLISFTRRLSMCLSFCLFVSYGLLATLRKKKLLSGSSWKFYQRYMRGPEKNWLNFGIRGPFQDPHQGTFWRILQHCEIRQFFIIWLISLGSLIGSSRTLYHRCTFRHGSLQWIVQVLRIQTPPWRRSALSGWSCLP